MGVGQGNGEIVLGEIKALKAYKAEQGTLALTLALMLARDGADVLADIEWRLRHPESLSKRFVAAVIAARKSLGEDQLPIIRLHDLRHTHATLLLAAGFPSRLSSERLGQASAMITLGVYAHVMPGMQAEAAATFGALLAGEA